MRITKRQLRRIINEALTQSQRATAAYAAEHRREHGQKGVWKTPAGDDEVFWKEGDLVRKIDYRGDGWGGDYEKSVGDQIGTVVEIDEDIDGTQYTVIFPDGTTVMDTGDSFEAVSKIREAAGDQLPYKSGQPWRGDAPVGSGASQEDDLDVELTDKEIEASMGWESADEWYVVERTGAGWDERFFVEMAGWRPERIVYGPFDKAKGFTTEAEAERVQVTIDEMDGYHTRIRPASFFQEGK